MNGTLTGTRDALAQGAGGLPAETPLKGMQRSAFLSLLGLMTVSTGVRRVQASRPIVYLATYSHIDADWLWPFQEGEQQADSTFRSVLAVLDRFPDVRFSMSTAAHYRWVRESDPPIFDRIKKAVARGQWEPIGGWWVEADTNIPSGESLMRQGLHGQREFMRDFGIRSKVAFLPDSFGSSANLPAILRAQGFTSYVMKRGAFNSGASPPPERFMWRGLGRSSILTYNMPLWNGSNDVIAKVGELAKFTFREPPLVIFGLGDHGGGPSRAAIEALQTWRAAPDAPELRLTRISEYLERRPLPTLELAGELEGDLPGSLANAARLKRANHQAERALLDCERLDVIAHVMAPGAAPPTLDEDWQLLLQRQHHDTISGTAVFESMQTAIAEIESLVPAVQARTRRLLERAVNRIDHQNTDEYVLAVFNPLDHLVHVPVVHTIGAGSFSKDADYTLKNNPNRALDARGHDIPVQIAGAADGAFSGAIYPLVFTLDVPPFGYTTARLRWDGSALSRSAPEQVMQIENERLTARFDPHTGHLISIRNRTDRKEYLRAPSRLVVYRDTADSWGRFQVPVAASDEAGVPSLVAWRVMEAGAARSVLRVESAYGKSRLSQDWSLVAGEAFLRCRLRIDWSEPQTRLGFEVAHIVEADAAEYDIPFGRVTRAFDEVVHPAISSVTVSASAHALALVGAGSHAFWAAKGRVGVTLLRSTGYASMSEKPAAFTRDQAQDLGEMQCAFGIVAQAPDPRSVARFAQVLDRHFPVAWVGVHRGDAPAENSFASVEPAWTLPSVRRAPDGDTLLVRVHDESGKARRGRLAVSARTWSGEVDAFGITTVRLARTGSTELGEDLGV